MRMRFIASVFSFSLLITAPAFADDITLGVAGPMSGPLAAFGEQISHGAQLATDEINAQGGLLGRKIVLDIQDDACDPKQARNVASKFVNEKTAAVFGHWCAAASMAASGVYGEEDTLQIEVGSLLSELTQHGLKTVFRVSATDKNFASAIGDYIVEHNPRANVAIVTDRPAVTMALTKYLQEFFKTAPNKLVDVEEITTGDEDFSSVIDKLRSLHSNVVVCSCYTQEAGLLARQLQEKKLNVWFYSWDTINSVDFLNIVGKDNTGKIVSIDYARPPAGPLYQHFADEMKKRHWPMETQSAITYAAVMMFADAVKATNSFDAKKVAAALHADIFHTVLGDVRFAPNGDRIDPAFAAYQWVEGQITMKENLSPHSVK